MTYDFEISILPRVKKSPSVFVVVNFIVPLDVKPTQNAYIERFNKSFRNGVLNCYRFETLEDIRNITSKWVDDYNHERPHASIGGLSPIMYNKQKLLGLRSAALHSNQEALLNENNL